MRVLIIGTSTDPRRHTSGFNLGYELGFSRLGCEVTSISHREIPTHTGIGYDFVLLRDTTVNIDALKHLVSSAKHFAVFTHSEFNQGKHDVEKLKKMNPEVIFLDQPLGGFIFKDLPIPSIFLGYGANDFQTEDRGKNIDVLWVGHGYAVRQGEVKNQVWPLKDLGGFNVKVHGNGQPDGPLSIPDMLQAMTDSRIVIHIGGPHTTDNGGYGGRRIYDALLHKCLVVATWSPLCEQVFPLGVIFCKRDEVRMTVSRLLNGELDYSSDKIMAAFHWTQNSQLIMHKAAAMLEAVGLRTKRIY